MILQNHKSQQAPSSWNEFLVEGFSNLVQDLKRIMFDSFQNAYPRS